MAGSEVGGDMADRDLAWWIRFGGGSGASGVTGGNNGERVSSNEKVDWWGLPFMLEVAELGLLGSRFALPPQFSRML